MDGVVEWPVPSKRVRATRLPSLRLGFAPRSWSAARGVCSADCRCCRPIIRSPLHREIPWIRCSSARADSCRARGIRWRGALAKTRAGRSRTDSASRAPAFARRSSRHLDPPQRDLFSASHAEKRKQWLVPLAELLAGHVYPIVREGTEWVSSDFAGGPGESHPGDARQ